MFKLIDRFLTCVKVKTYNYLNTDITNTRRIKPIGRITLEEDLTGGKAKILSKDEEKQMKIDTLLYIKHMKNTYHKYTDKSKFNQVLYDKFVEDDSFDNGETAFDDDDDVRIFDRYILDYIKNRNDIMTYMLCKNKSIRVVTKMEDLEEMRSKDSIDILFVMDMSDKDIFTYCYSILKSYTNCTTAKAIVLSLVLKMNRDYVRIGINPKISHKFYHPHLVLENMIQYY